MPLTIKTLLCLCIAQAVWPEKSLEKLKILTPLQKLPKNVWDLGKLIVATGFEKLPKVL